MNPNQCSMNYRIYLQDYLDKRWLRQFEGLEITLLPNGETVISGVMDQSELHGVLNRIRDLGLEIISIQRDGGQK